MKKDSVQISIIIVNYNTEKELTACVMSIIRFKPKVSFEIIVVDNDEESKLGITLGKNFPQVKYVRSGRNIGFGAGNNLGAKSASGEYLFFLNPDTIVENNSIEYLFDRIENGSRVGVIGPQLTDNKGKILQSISGIPFLPKSLFVFSFLAKIWSNNPFLKKYHNSSLDRSREQDIDVVSGACMMVKKSLFNKVGGFDERFFMYFEEADFCFKIKKIGYKILYYPKAKIIHLGGRSSYNKKWIEKTFEQSRFKFFKKYHGLAPAFLAEVLLRFFKLSNLLLLIILTLSALLNFYRINELMVFIGDQGWFYLSARDMLIKGQIPLVGIASSHPWLHQGPFWTYLLALFLWLFNFDPVSGAYSTVIMGFFSVIGIYIVGSALFTKRVGLIASFLYATSPLVVYYTRFPYHTSPIPLFVIALIYFLYKIIQGRLNYLPLAILSLTMLYNFEIATAALWGVVVSILIYKYFKNKNIVSQIFNKKIIIYSMISFLTPLLPMILYDVGNGFPQTIKFGVWSVYRVISLFGHNSQQAFSVNKIILMLDFLSNNFTKLIFAQNNLVSFIIIAFLIVWAIYMLYKKESNNSYNLILLLILIPFFMVVLNQVPSDAYLPIFFPTIILFFAIFLNFIMSKRRMLFPVIIFIIILAAGNINYMIKNNFMFDRSGNLFTLDKRLQASRQILNISQKKDYNLKGKGSGSQFESFTMNYEYLTWWLGHGPAKNNESLKIYISENANGIKIESKNTK